MDIENQEKLIAFIYEAVAKIAIYHKIDAESAKGIFHQVTIAGYDKYGEAIANIDPQAKFTNDGKHTGMGKTIFKGDKNYIIINFDVARSLLLSNFSNITARHVLFHEIGHCVNNILNPECRIEETTNETRPMAEVCVDSFKIAIDEYKANCYIDFLFTDVECQQIFDSRTLYADINNLYTDITNRFDLFNRIRKLQQSLEGKIFALHGHNDIIAAAKSVYGEYSERRGTVYNNIIIIFLHRRNRIFKSEKPFGRAVFDELDFRAG